MDVRRFGQFLPATLLVAAVIAGCGDPGQQPGVASGTGANGGGTTASTADGSTRNGGKEKGDSRSGPNEGAAERQRREEAAAVKNRQGFKAEPPPIQVYSSATSAARVSQPTAVAARSQAQLAELVKREQGNRTAEISDISVNFDSDRQVWAVFMPKSPAGSRLSVIRVASNGETVLVTASMTVPSQGCKVSGGVAHPTAWVETRTLKGKPRIRVIRVSRPCR